MERKVILKLVIAILVVICIIGIVKIGNYIRENKIVDGIRTQKDIDILRDEVENYVSDKITPKGLSKLYGNYKGENDLNDMYRGLYKFVNYLPTLAKKIKYDQKDSIISYYESNIKEIKNNTGIGNQDDFVSLIEYLNKSGYNGQKFVSCEIDTSTFNTGKKYFTFELKFNFENLDNDFKLKVNFANYSSAQKLVYFSVIEEDTAE